MPLANLKYTKLPVACCITHSTLSQCVQQLGPAFIYSVFIHSSKVIEMRSIARELMADVRNNPFAPYLNICEDPALHPNEWYVAANGQRVGSEGV
jgi:hypothetical protein